MAGFNMMDLMNGASKAQTSKPSYELRELPIGKLIPNPANAYSMSGIEELADSILLAGRVLQNLVVKPADENGNYMIISGHRRHLASKMLVERGHNEFATVSALVENERNETLQELMLIYTNSTARELTDAEKMRQATRATELLKELKEKGEFGGKGRIRDAVAKMLNTTTGQIGRYQAIANNLKNEDLKDKFEKGEMGVSAAYEASRLSEEGQGKIAEQMKDGKTVSVHDIKKENGTAGGSEKDIPTNSEGLPIKTKTLSILPKFKTTITLKLVEKDGKFYIGADYNCRTGDYLGGGYSPKTNTIPYDTEQEAIEAEIKCLAGLSKHIHKALWESGYRIVGEPVREETVNSPVPMDNADKTAQTGAQDATGALPETEDEPEEETSTEDETADEEELRSLWIRKKAIVGVIAHLEGQIGLKAKEVDVWRKANQPLKVKIAQEAADYLAELQEAANESLDELNQMLGGADEEFEKEISEGE
ncbi:MAG: hypothetical protein E7200_05255 [Selenomonas ruminantium]|nr:hypothetical protein [Selenomonas ruminantium]